MKINDSGRLEAFPLSLSCVRSQAVFREALAVTEMALLA